ncbi:MAG: branched-chain amino acid ABC transporter permease, partial [Candidatus Nezhaarchaeota archaeon]|nr:branched-chain amino acid ABC transporter permease [Candidatus Nezhaarchaeota archaeon]
TDYITYNPRIIAQINAVLKEDVVLAVSILALSLALAMVVGALLGIASSYPLMRLHGAPLAMSLLAIAELAPLIGRNYPEIIGGPLGVAVPNPFAWAGALRFPIITLFMMLVAAAVFAFVRTLTRTPLGRLLRAIRDDEVAASALGKDVAKARTKVMAVSSAIAALGGALYAFYACSVTAPAFNRFTWTFWPWVMVILGGIANNLGTVLGAFAFVLVRKLIIYYKDVLSPYLPFDVVWLDNILLGVALILILLFRPEGILPERPISTVNVKKLMSPSARSKRGGQP